MATARAHIHYEPPPLLEEGETDPHAGADITIATAAGAWLRANLHKQASLFNIISDVGQGIVTVTMPRLMGNNNVLIIKTDAIDGGIHALHRELFKATNELLERYRLRRGRFFTMDEFLDTASKIPIIGLNNRKVWE